MKKMFWIGLFLILALGFWNRQSAAYIGPRTASPFTASPDILANSSDTHSLGNSSNYWRRGFGAYYYMSEHISPPTAISSFGVIWTSTDNNLYFTNDSGTSTQLN